MVKIFVKNFGVMSFELDEENAPITCQNFISLIKEGYYDGLIFHRIIKNFMIQGGAGEYKGKRKAEAIKGEFKSNGVDNNHLHRRGTISMARTYVPDSASSQFFICHRDCPHLDGEYAAFGEMVDGFPVLDKIASVRTDSRDFPKEEVVIEKIIIE